ncbi:hypothetical protein Ga0102493_112580 [Erythrobacter litoralis]|uniref:Uncharacterized protein n=1 Tax=Erythrobacter litoralis TaxID=39960 RepID=A0A074N1Z6_9SPHN|nr:hypothetical protein [Erythrobacter litoralis]AOL23592.1 hypothetical protein Ga0102493_112580 [Erythrobacter litoralis]KEO98925.1 hypothetical protein EH32_07410 [Erythrobacter litoralis]
MTKPIGPGEVRTRQRQRRQIVYVAIAALLGGGIGFVTGFFDKGDGSLFTGEWEALSLDPAIAVILALALVAGFTVLPLYGFTQVDEMKREYNLIAFTGGCIAVITGFPVWAVLYAGGFVPAPHAFGVFAIAFVAMMVSYPIACFVR